MTGLSLAFSVLGMAIAPYPGFTKPSSLTESQPNLSVMKFNPPVLSNTSEEPGGRGRGGGSRSAGCQKYLKVAALVPSMTMNDQEMVWGLTTESHPIFWFYIPSELTSDVPLEFVLQDRNDSLIYQTKFKAGQTPAGIISIPLPQTVVALQPNLSYRWTLSLDCNPDKPSDAPFVQGSIRRVVLEPELQKQIDVLPNPLQRAKYYAHEGIWYDALTTLGESLQQSRSRNPELTAAWDDLLKQVGLADVIDAPIVPCCRL